MTAIPESVQAELVFVGTSRKDLQLAIGGKIRNPKNFDSGAERAAHTAGLVLWVSWAATSRPEAYKAGLVLAHEAEHGRRPGFEDPETGTWTSGVRLLVLAEGVAEGDSEWSDWMPMNNDTIPQIPREPGVYRIGVAQPVQGAEREPGRRERQGDRLPENVIGASSGEGDEGQATTYRLTLDEFIKQIPYWRDEYLKNNMCSFKVEAFIQRDWNNLCLDQPLCKEYQTWVYDRINQVRGKEDSDRLEDDIAVVYRWGGGRGPSLFRQIMNNNSPQQIQKRMEAAFAALGEGHPVQALEQLESLKHCGDSFGSKVLAMRSPKNAPIWDDIAKACLSEFKIGGKRVKSYEQFITFCEHIADELKRLGITQPRGVNGRWYLRDIEMAIFQFGWDNDKFKGRITGELR